MAFKKYPSIQNWRSEKKILYAYTVKYYSIRNVSPCIIFFADFQLWLPTVLQSLELHVYKVSFWKSSTSTFEVFLWSQNTPISTVLIYWCLISNNHHCIIGWVQDWYTANIYSESTVEKLYFVLDYSFLTVFGLQFNQCKK